MFFKLDGMLNYRGSQRHHPEHPVSRGTLYPRELRWGSLGSLSLPHMDGRAAIQSSVRQHHTPTCQTGTSCVATTKRLHLTRKPERLRIIVAKPQDIVEPAPESKDSQGREAVKKPIPMPANPLTAGKL